MNDAHETSTKKKLETLLGWMQASVSVGSGAIMHQIDVSVNSFNAARDNNKEYTFNNHQGKDVGYTQYHTAFATSARDMLLASIQDVTRECADWNRDGCGIGIDGKLLHEMMHHALWAREKCDMFVGREVSTIITMLCIVTLTICFLLLWSGIGPASHDVDGCA